MSKLSIRGLGKLNKKEHLIIDVLDDIEDISDYMVSDNTYDEDGNLSNLLRHYYRFSRKIPIKKNDFIVLNTYSHTKGKDYVFVEGKNKKKNTHHFYWGLDKDVWNKGGDKATVYKLGYEHHKDIN